MPIHSNGPPLRLRDLRPGDRARVTGYADGALYGQRLIHLGLVAGTQVLVQRKAPLGDPMEIRFRSFSLTLRPAEADCLLLEKL